MGMEGRETWSSLRRDAIQQSSDVVVVTDVYFVSMEDKATTFSFFEPQTIGLEPKQTIDKPNWTQVNIDFC